MFKQNKMTTHHTAINQGANLNNVSNLTNTKLMINANLYICIYMSSEFRTASYFKPHILPVFRASLFLCANDSIYYNPLHQERKIYFFVLV